VEIQFRYFNENYFFKGTETYSLDPKSRVVLAEQWRSDYDGKPFNTFVLTRGYETCIHVYPLKTWRVYEKILSQMNPFGDDDIYFVHYFTMMSSEVELDTQNRLIIPKQLREFALIEPGNKLEAVGMIDHVEYWNPDERRKFLKLTGDRKQENENYKKIVNQALTSHKNG
jgi:MraZ protein